MQSPNNKNQLNFHFSLTDKDNLIPDYSLDVIPMVAKKNWFLRPAANCVGGG